MISSIETIYRDIDKIKSVSKMLRRVKKLEQETQKDVVLHALKSSCYQFTWSWIATEVKIPESEWPKYDGKMD